MQSPPQDKVLPEDDAAKGGKPGQVQPLARRCVRHSGEEGKLFGIKGLVELLLSVQCPQAESPQLFFMAHGALTAS